MYLPYKTCLFVFLQKLNARCIELSAAQPNHLESMVNSDGYKLWDSETIQKFVPLYAKRRRLNDGWQLATNHDLLGQELSPCFLWGMLELYLIICICWVQKWWVHVIFFTKLSIVLFATYVYFCVPVDDRNLYKRALFSILFVWKFISRNSKPSNWDFIHFFTNPV